MHNSDLKFEFSKYWESNGFHYEFDVTQNHKITSFAPPNSLKSVTNKSNNESDALKVLWGKIYKLDKSFKLIDYTNALKNSNLLKKHFEHILYFDDSLIDEDKFLKITVTNNKYYCEVINIGYEESKIVIDSGFDEFFKVIECEKLIKWADVINRY